MSLLVQSWAGNPTKNKDLCIIMRKTLLKIRVSEHDLLLLFFFCFCLMLLCNFMVFLFYLLIVNNHNNLLHFVTGAIIVLMFSQRSVSFMYIFPVLIYYLFKYKKNFIPALSLVSSFAILMFLIGLNNFNKTETFYFVSSDHQYFSYYHYFSAKI